MAIVQISKMQFRRGYEIDLPGAPTSLTPLVFGPSLLSGEFCFTVDTGRLFVGHSPNASQANYQRREFPYQNIEVLTENSSDALNRVIGSARKSVTASAFNTATLVPETVTWRDVAVIQPDGSTTSFLFAGTYLLAQVDYFIYAATGVPIRQGTLRVMSEEGAQEAAVADSSISARRQDLIGSDRFLPEKVYENVYFRVIRNGTNSTTGFRLQYKNALAGPAKLFFNVTRPQP